MKTLTQHLTAHIVHKGFLVFLYQLGETLLVFSIIE